MFVLIDAIRSPGEGRVKEEDLVMLQQLRELHIPHQIVLAKVDRALFPRGVKSPLTVGKFAVGERNVRAVFKDVKRIIWGMDDGVGFVQRSVEEKGLLPFGQLLAVTAENTRWVRLGEHGNGALGIDALRWAFLVATGLVKTLPSQIAEAKRLAKLAKVNALERKVDLGGISGSEVDSDMTGKKKGEMHLGVSGRHESKGEILRYGHSKKNANGAASQFR